MGLLRTRGRVAVCGGIAHYNEDDRVPDRFFPMDMVYSFQRVEGEDGGGWNPWSYTPA